MLRAGARCCRQHQAARPSPALPCWRSAVACRTRPRPASIAGPRRRRSPPSRTAPQAGCQLLDSGRPGKHPWSASPASLQLLSAVRLPAIASRNGHAYPGGTPGIASTSARHCGAPTGPRRESGRGCLAQHIQRAFADAAGRTRVRRRRSSAAGPAAVRCPATAGRRSQQAVEPVQHSAMSGYQRAAVLEAGKALAQAFGEIADHRVTPPRPPSRAAAARSASAQGQPQRRGQQRAGNQSAPQSGPGLAGRYARRQLAHCPSARPAK